MADLARVDTSAEADDADFIGLFDILDNSILLFSVCQDHRSLLL